MAGWRAIEIHPEAPRKPALGQACNGCGACCAVEPCPVGMFVLFQFRGRCRALWWRPEHGRYVCGMVVRPEGILRWLPAATAPWAGRLFSRWIAVGAGCDVDYVMDDGQPQGKSGS